MKTAVIERDVDIKNIAVFKFTLIWDAMADDFVR